MQPVWSRRRIHEMTTLPRFDQTILAPAQRAIA